MWPINPQSPQAGLGSASRLIGATQKLALKTLLRDTEPARGMACVATAIVADGNP